MADLAPLCHHIVTSTVKEPLPTGQYVNSAAEQSIILLFLMPGKDNWKSPLSTTQMFAQWQCLILLAAALDAHHKQGDYATKDASNAPKDEDGGLIDGDSGTEDEGTAMDPGNNDGFPGLLEGDFDSEAKDAEDGANLSPFEDKQELEPLEFTLPALYQNGA